MGSSRRKRSRATSPLSVVVTRRPSRSSVLLTESKIPNSSSTTRIWPCSLCESYLTSRTIHEQEKRRARVLKGEAARRRSVDCSKENPPSSPCSSTNQTGATEPLASLHAARRQDAVFLPHKRKRWSRCLNLLRLLPQRAPWILSTNSGPKASQRGTVGLMSRPPKSSSWPAGNSKMSLKHFKRVGFSRLQTRRTDSLP